MPRKTINPALALLLTGLPTISAVAQTPPAPAPAAALRYADLADLADGAPLVLDATVRAAIRLKPEVSPGLGTGKTRFYVTAALNTLIRGPAGTPGQLHYLVDLPNDARGKPPKLNKRRVLLLARAVPGRVGEIQLVAPDAQLDWTADLDQRLRGILNELVAKDAPPQIRAIGKGFHVPGALPGEGESQIFLATANGAPVSLSILRRPGQTPQWSVALGEIVDESAAVPQRDTLLWYRLTCFLPRQLPAASVSDAGAEEARQLRVDYQLVIAGLGPCPRARVRVQQ